MLTSFEIALSSARSKDEIQQYMEHHPESFEEALLVVLDNRHPFAWRAAWLLYELMEEKDKRIRRKVPQLIRLLPEMNHSLQREVLKILFRTEITEEEEGPLFNHCSAIWKNLKKQAAARYYAYRMLLIIAGRHPELLFEVKALAIPEYVETLSPGIRKSFTSLVAESERAIRRKWNKPGNFFKVG